MNMPNQRTVVLIVILTFFSIAVFFASQYYVSLQNLKIQKSLIQTYQHNEKILNFTKLLISKVIKLEGSESEISFEDRLQLENTVRDINNKAIFDQWQKFIDSKNEVELQKRFKELLELLVNKIIP